MIRTRIIPCKIDRNRCDELNRESGRIYTQTMVEHYRIYRKGVWLSKNADGRYGDWLDKDKPRILHAHSVDAAQQGFAKSCKVAKSTSSRYPYKRKWYRTTIWKKSGIRKTENGIILSLARGNDPIEIEHKPDEEVIEVRLVYDRIGGRYNWHIVLDDGSTFQQNESVGIAAIDLGEIHPVAIVSETDSAIITCRELRSTAQLTNKMLAKFQREMSKHKNGSKRHKRLAIKKRMFLSRQKRRRGDIEHKVSREAIKWAYQHNIGEIAIGDVRNISHDKKLNRKSQQKISGWSHGRMRSYISYKAEALGIKIASPVDEKHTSKTCPKCGQINKPKGRNYSCLACGFNAHRDIVGASNILSRHLFGEVACIIPSSVVKYRRPINRSMRSPARHAASCSISLR